MTELLETGAPPYIAVIFNFKLRDVDLSEYRQSSEFLMGKALRLPGFYGEEAIRLEDGDGLTVSYWRSLEDIKDWRDDEEHTAIRRLGIKGWYEKYDLRVAEITRAYGLRSRQVVGQGSADQNSDDPQVVIFSSLRTAGDDEAYNRAALEMAARASQQEGFLDLMSLRQGGGLGITVSFWKTADDAAAWKADAVHKGIQEKGRRQWYEDYNVRVGQVLRQKTFSRRN